MIFLAILLLGSLLTQRYLIPGKIIPSNLVLAMTVQGEQECPNVNMGNYIMITILPKYIFKCIYF